MVSLEKRTELMASKMKERSSGKAHDSAAEISRVRKVVGQLEGVEKMILDKRYPPHIIQQVKAASSALMSLRFEILKRHLHECLNEAVKSGNQTKLVEQILEATQMQSMK